MARKSGDKQAVAALELKLGSAEVPEQLALYVTAYVDLDSEREWLMPIPWSRIIGYCRYYGMSERQTDDMLDYVRLIDKEVLKKRAAEANRNAS